MATVLIVGGGVSGLSAGIYACLAGHRAVVFEKHGTVGGNLTGWQRGEYHIDNCIHWLTGTRPETPTYRMWCELGALGDVPPVQGESLYTCSYEGQSLSLYADTDRTEREMLAVSPKDAEETRALFRAVRAFQHFFGIGGEGQGKFRPLLSAVPELWRYYRLSTGELSARFSHPLLRRFILAFWGEDFGSLALVMVFAHYGAGNGALPAGGSLAMAERMRARLESLGGNIRTGTEVAKVCREGKRASGVQLGGGEYVAGDYVILTGDPAVMFPSLLDLPLPAWLKRQYHDPRLIRFSSWHCAFSCERASIPFRGDYIFDLPGEYRDALCTAQVIVREFSHELGFAPPGMTVLETMIFCTEEDAQIFIARRAEDKAAYDRMKADLAATLTGVLVGEFPAWAGKLTLLDVWTPATYRRYTGSQMGSYMSFALPSRRFPWRAGCRVPGLSHAYLATQWQQMPGGLPIAAEGGRLAVQALCREEERVRRTHRTYPRPDPLPT